MFPNMCEQLRYEFMSKQYKKDDHVNILTYRLQWERDALRMGIPRKRIIKDIFRFHQFTTRDREIIIRKNK